MVLTINCLILFLHYNFSFDFTIFDYYIQFLIAITPTADEVATRDRERSGTRERVTPSVPLRDRLLAARWSATQL